MLHHKTLHIPYERIMILCLSTHIYIYIYIYACIHIYIYICIPICRTAPLKSQSSSPASAVHFGRAKVHGAALADQLLVGLALFLTPICMYKEDLGFRVIYGCRGVEFKLAGLGVQGLV